MWPREGARWVLGLGGSAEGQARQWRSSGGRGSLGSGEPAVWLGQHVGVQARCVQGEGLGVLRRPWKWTGRWAHRGGVNGGRRCSVAGCVRARQRRGLSQIRAGGQLGASGVTPVTHARVEGSRHGRRHAPLRQPMARHGRCASRWIGATWRGQLATAVTGSSRRHSTATDGRSSASVCAPDAGTTRTAACRRGHARSRGRARPGVPGQISIRWYSFQTRFSLKFETKPCLPLNSKVVDQVFLFHNCKGW
jgi:hypothetical protein